MKSFLKKLEYHFLVERTKIEKSSFPYKTAMSEANVKTNSMVTNRGKKISNRGKEDFKSGQGLQIGAEQLLIPLLHEKNIPPK